MPKVYAILAVYSDQPLIKGFYFWTLLTNSHAFRKPLQRFRYRFTALLNVLREEQRSENVKGALSRLGLRYHRMITLLSK
jgi:hypothetical protein